MSYTLNFQSFGKNAENNSTSATFYNAESREIVTATPEDSSQCPMFCQILNMKSKEYTSKLKDDGKTITLRFPMNCILNLSKDNDGNETLTLSPADGCEELFKASQLVCTTVTGKTERQMAFKCKIKTTKAFVDVPASGFGFVGTGLEEALYDYNAFDSDR